MSSAISNPPFNLKWTVPMFAQLQRRFNTFGVPPESNANYAFILTALDSINKTACFILPNGVLDPVTAEEKEIKQQLVENNLVKAVIAIPNNMFESTDIGTCILLFDKAKRDNETIFIDLRSHAVKEEREQKGQFGGASHENRVYKKTFKVLPDELIDIVVDAVENKKTVKGMSYVASKEEVYKNNYSLIPSRYIPFESKEPIHRNFQEIADNINYIQKVQNSCKLIINETIAKDLGLNVELFKSSKNQSEELVKVQKDVGIKLINSDYIQFTKNKNEFVFKCNDKDMLPSIFIEFYDIWRNQIATLNAMQNTYLAELRDAMLPDLMSGKLDVSKTEEKK